MPHGAEPNEQCETPLAHPDIWWARVDGRWLPVVAKTWVKARELFRQLPERIEDGHTKAQWKAIMADESILKLVVNMDSADIVFAEFHGSKIKSIVAHKRSYEDEQTMKHTVAMLRRTAEQLEKSFAANQKRKG